MAIDILSPFGAARTLHIWSGVIENRKVSSYNSSMSAKVKSILSSDDSASSTLNAAGVSLSFSTHRLPTVFRVRLINMLPFGQPLRKFSQPNRIGHTRVNVDVACIGQQHCGARVFSCSWICQQQDCVRCFPRARRVSEATP